MGPGLPPTADQSRTRPVKMAFTWSRSSEATLLLECTITAIPSSAMTCSVARARRSPIFLRARAALSASLIGREAMAMSHCPSASPANPVTVPAASMETVSEPVLSDVWRGVAPGLRSIDRAPLRVKKASTSAGASSPPIVLEPHKRRSGIPAAGPDGFDRRVDQSRNPRAQATTSATLAPRTTLRGTRFGATGFKVSLVGACGARSSGSAAGVCSVGRLTLRGGDALADPAPQPPAIALEEVGDEAPNLLAPRLSHAAPLQGRLEGLAHLGGSGESLVALAGQRLVGDGCDGRRDLLRHRGYRGSRIAEQLLGRFRRVGHEEEPPPAEQLPHDNPRPVDV